MGCGKGTADLGEIPQNFTADVFMQRMVNCRCGNFTLNEKKNNQIKKLNIWAKSDILFRSRNYLIIFRGYFEPLFIRIRGREHDII